jgi:hypothetical protein
MDYEIHSAHYLVPLVINFATRKDVVGSDIMAAVGNWQLKVDLQEPWLAEYKNRLAQATADVVTATVCLLFNFEGRGDDPNYQCCRLWGDKGKTYQDNLEEQSKGHSTDFYSGEMTCRRLIGKLLEGIHG